MLAIALMNRWLKPSFSTSTNILKICIILENTLVPTNSESSLSSCFIPSGFVSNTHLLFTIYANIIETDIAITLLTVGESHASRIMVKTQSTNVVATPATIYVASSLLIFFNLFSPISLIIWTFFVLDLFYTSSYMHGKKTNNPQNPL